MTILKRLLWCLAILGLVFAAANWLPSTPTTSSRIEPPQNARAAQRRPPRSRFQPLLADAAVRLELDLSEAQRTELDSLIEQYQQRYDQSATDASQRAEIKAAFWSKTRTHLTAAQQDRLNQINWQLMGVHVFDDEEFSSTLQITPEQSELIARVKADFEADKASMTRHLQRLRARQRAIQDMVAQLEPQQQESFQLLIGPKFTFVYPKSQPSSP